MDNQYVKIIKPFIPSIIVGFGIMFLLLLLRPSIYWIILGVVGVTLYAGRHNPLLVVIKSVLWNVGFLLVLFFIWKLIGGYGLLGLFFACLAVVGVILFRRRKLFINTIREIEKILWGKTNDRRKKYD